MSQAIDMIKKKIAKAISFHPEYTIAAPFRAFYGQLLLVLF